MLNLHLTDCKFWLILFCCCCFPDSYLDSLPFEGELNSLTQGLTTLSLPDIELPPVDIDSLGLGVF